MNFHHAGAQYPSHHSQFPNSYHAPNRGPPPTKKPKGNPIITRYPPPPGYRPPIPPPTPVQQSGWQQPFSAPAYSHPPFPGPWQPSHGQTQLYQVPHSQYPSYPTQQWPQQYPQPYSTITNGYPPPQTSHSLGVQPTWQGPVPAPQSAPPLTQYPPPNPFDQAPRRHSAAPLSYHDHGSRVMDAMEDPYPPQSSTSRSDDELEESFDSECYFARHPEEIQNELSLGLIEWKPPLPTKRALPSTFAEAELEALAPRIPKPWDDESISEFHIDSRRDEALNSVRLSESWREIQGNIIFREFPAICREILSLYELISSYKDRFDPVWAAGERISPTIDLSRDPTPVSEQTRGESMDVDLAHDESRHNSVTEDQHALNYQVLDDLEQELGYHVRSSRPADQLSTHSRSTSVAPQNLPRVKRPKPLPPVRDQAQEDILAALGVTGSPKLVYETPGPAFGPPPEARSGQNSRANSVSSSRGDSQGNSYPPPSHRFVRDISPSYDPWINRNSQQNKVYPADRPTSAASHVTTTGSDFHAHDNDATPRPKINRHDSRKRYYVDSEDESIGEHGPQDEDITPKQRRKQQRVGDMVQ